jgi:hypothetical protein
MEYVTVDVGGRPYAVVDPTDGGLEKFLQDNNLGEDVRTRPSTSTEADLMDAEKAAVAAAGGNPDNVVAVQI